MLTLSSICRNSQPDNKAHVRLIVLFFFFLQRMFLFLFFLFFSFFFLEKTLSRSGHIFHVSLPLVITLQRELKSDYYNRLQR